MSSDPSSTLAFKCPKCGKRLKARASATGKRVQCPGCQQTVTVPKADTSPPSDPQVNSPIPPSAITNDASSKVKDDAARGSKVDELSLSLSEPAISDLDDRLKVSNDIRQSKEQERKIARAKRANRGLSKPGANDEAQVTSSRPDGKNQPSQRPEKKVKSIFDEDLDLDELTLEPEVERPNKKSGNKSSGMTSRPRPSVSKAAESEARSSAEDGDSLGDLDSLVPELPSSNEGNLEIDDGGSEEQEYRVTCRVCGTAQYVSPSAQGMKIKCPDCHSDFKVPPPPAKSKAKAAKKKLSQMLPAGFGYVPEPSETDDVGEHRQKQRTADLLEKAKVEIGEEDEERLYDSDFDTADFVQRTFGFLKDPLTLVQVVVYGLVFASLFGLMAFSLNDTESQFGRGLLLISVILIPLVGLLFALPMLSGCLALIESVANKQYKVNEVPAFNVFDNFADLFVLAVAMLESIIPGFMIGSLFGGESNSTMFGVGGMIVSGFALFPYLLLSMMDNGSLLNPISSAVAQSFKDAGEAWGGYYLKTFIATAALLICWLVLLGRGAVPAAIADALLHLYIFFTCQQIGALADSIGDSLSFEFTPPDNDEDLEEAGPNS